MIMLLFGSSPNISGILKIFDILRFLSFPFTVLGLHSSICWYKCPAESIGKFFTFLFSAADGYVGITIIFGAFAFFWFIGIHGPSIVEPAIAAIICKCAEVNEPSPSKVCTLIRSLHLVRVHRYYGWYWCNSCCSVHV